MNTVFPSPVADADAGASSDPAAEIVAGLSLAEKAGFLAGVDAWHLRGSARHDLPPLFMADCGHGVTLCGERTSPSTCMPTGIGMAATWDTQLMEEAGGVLGRECQALGVSMLLGPKLNLHRIPLNGRSFETFSEDPVLAGRLGGAIIRGIQAQGVGACVKAMAANNQQHLQGVTEVVAEERTLRELYLRNFEIAIEEGNPTAVMTSYNRLHGVNASENEWMITQVLKNEWGFEGLVVSDWNSVESAKSYTSGLDLEMPGPGRWLNRDAVINAVESGALSEEDLDDRARRVIRTILQYGKPEGGREASAGWLDSAQNRDVAYRIAAGSITLLKNENGLLPLKKETLKRVAVIGPNASVARLGGGGSASVTPFYSVSPLEGIRAALGEGVEVVYEEGCSMSGQMEPVATGWEDLTAAFYNCGEIAGEPDVVTPVTHIDYSWGWAAPGLGVTRFEYAVRFRGRLTPASSGVHRFGVFGQEGGIRLKINGIAMVADWIPLIEEGDFEAAFSTRYRTVEIELEAGKAIDIELDYGKRRAHAAVRLEWEQPGRENPLDRAVAASRDADTVILCLGLCNLLEGGSHDRTSMDLPEAQVELIRRISEVNPRCIVTLNNGGPVVLPWAASVGAIVECWYPGQEGGRALADVLMGEINPSGKLPDTIPYRLEDHASAANYPGDGSKVRYEEGIFIGYRHFDHAEIEPHFPFGFGLSYTTFAISAPSLDQRTISHEDILSVTVSVTNTGKVAGAEVVQIYVGEANPKAERPPLELRAFEKVRLSPGETKSVTLSLNWRSFAYWNTDLAAWHVEPGEHIIAAGSHSRNLQRATVEFRPGERPRNGRAPSRHRNVNGNGHHAPGEPSLPV